MNTALWAAKTGLDAQQTRMAVISNNLANSATTGFKRARPVFQDLLYQNRRQVGGQSSQDTRYPSGLMLGTGVRLTATERNFSQGTAQPTGRPLDVAVTGRGFFQILTPGGELGYTRSGNFQIDEQGQLVTASGYLLQPAITIPDGAQSVTIGADGVVSARLTGQAAPTQLGNIQLVDFINMAGLEPIGRNLFVETAASGAPNVGTPGQNGLGELQQEALEASNVNVVEELVNMIETQRAYEMNSKAISTNDEMLQYANNNL